MIRLSYRENLHSYSIGTRRCSRGFRRSREFLTVQLFMRHNGTGNSCLEEQNVSDKFFMTNTSATSLRGSPRDLFRLFVPYIPCSLSLYLPLSLTPVLFGPPVSTLSPPISLHSSSSLPNSSRPLRRSFYTGTRGSISESYITSSTRVAKERKGCDSAQTRKNKLIKRWLGEAPRRVSTPARDLHSMR